MKKISSYLFVLLVGLVAGLFLARKKGPGYIIEKHPFIVNMHPKIATIKIAPKPIKIYPRRDTIIIRHTDTIHIPADTSAIIADYLSERRYIDTLKDDSIAFVSIASSVQANRLIWQKMNYQNRVQTKIFKKYPPPRIYLGPSIFAGPSSGLGISASYSRKRSLYTMSAYSNMTFTLTWQYGFHLK